MNKKGDTEQVLFFIFFLVIAFLILYALSSYLSGYFNGSEFRKAYIAEDLGLTIDVLSFSPGNIKMKYSSPDEFIAENMNNELNVKIKDLEISRNYQFISKIDDFSARSKEISVSNNDKITVG